MSGGFDSVLFSDVDSSESFFDSLRGDYPEFDHWFAGKSSAGEYALVAADDDGILAFLYLKRERDEPIPLVGGRLPETPRLKIGTLKISERSRGDRLGEGAIGMALWQWRDSDLPEVYITVYEKHVPLVALLKKFGFQCAGHKPNGESIYVKSTSGLSYRTSYEPFPFVHPGFPEANILTVEQDYHDQLFPYSELARTPQEVMRVAAGNGVTKVYVGHGRQMAARPGCPVLIYRKFMGEGKLFRSVVTSYGAVTDVRRFKRDGQILLPYEEYRQLVKNKSVFDDAELDQHWSQRNVVVVELVYLGYFGRGHNVNLAWLKDRGFWREDHPNQTRYTPGEFFAILEGGGVSREDVVVDQPGAR